MAQHRSEEADKLIGKEIKVLDKGFVRLVDYMGSDTASVTETKSGLMTG